MVFWSRPVRRARLRHLFEDHGERAFAAAYRVLGQDADARDAVQEAFIALDQRLDAIDDEHALPWLLRTVRHRALDRLRQRARQPQPRESEVTSTELGGAAGAEQTENRERIAEALARLSQRQQEVICLRIYEARSFVTIARDLGISEGAAKTHFRRGLTRLGELFRPTKMEPK